MDNMDRHFTTNFARNTTKNLSKAGNSTVSPLQLLSSGVSSSYVSNNSKRKRSVLDRSVNLQDDASLVLALGSLSSSCTTLSSGKEIESSSIDLGPSTNLCLGNTTPEPKNVYCWTPQALEDERPKLDLELSLSTGPAESDITSVTQRSIPFPNITDAPVVGSRVQLGDERSTSSRWKLGPRVPPLQSTAITTLVDHVHGHSKPIADITTTPSKSSGACSSEQVYQKQRRNTSMKTCRFDGCTTGARGASGLCIAHGGGRRCQRAGCQKGAEGKTLFCKADGGGKRCQYPDCPKSAEGRTNYCIGHGGGRRCSHEGCIRAARGKSGLCIRHGGGKRCTIENCNKSAEGIPSLCISHGGGRRCQYPSCSKGAQGGTMLCKGHGGGKRCTIFGCTKGAEGNTQFCKGHGGGKRCTFEGGCTKSVHGGTSFCVNHGGGKRCAIPECTKSARGSTNFCVRHGGGKRCKIEGCNKGAQSRTDFCKAHGGGKRCSWGKLGSNFSGQAAAPCDKFSRGKSGMCSFHNAQMQDKQIHGGGQLDPTLQDRQFSSLEKTKRIFASSSNLADDITTAGSGGSSTNYMVYRHLIPPDDIFAAGKSNLSQFSLPEGRVHGGSLMAMLRSSTSVGPSNVNQPANCTLKPGKVNHTTYD